MSSTLDGTKLNITVIDTLNTLFNLTVPTCNAFVAAYGGCTNDGFGNTPTMTANGQLQYEVTAASYGIYIPHTALNRGNHTFNVYVSPTDDPCLAAGSITAGDLAKNLTYTFAIV
jgi:hypothetical protein